MNRDHDWRWGPTDSTWGPAAGFHAGSKVDSALRVHPCIPCSEGAMTFKRAPVMVEESCPVRMNWSSSTFHALRDWEDSLEDRVSTVRVFLGVSRRQDVMLYCNSAYSFV